MLITNPENATIEELKQVARVGSIETAIRRTAIQMLLSGADRQLVCSSMLVTDRALRKWISAFNTAGVDSLIVNKRPGGMGIIKDRQAIERSDLIDGSQRADLTFCTAKAFHGHIGQQYQVECSYGTVVRFFHGQGFALKMPQPCFDKQDEKLREEFLKQLEQLYGNPDADIPGLLTNMVFKATPSAETMGQTGKKNSRDPKRRTSANECDWNGLSTYRIVLCNRSFPFRQTWQYWTLCITPMELKKPLQSERYFEKYHKYVGNTVQKALMVL